MAAVTLYPRTPVLVGGGQLSHRVDRGATPLEPVELLAEAARAAAADTGAADQGAVLAAVDAIRVVSILSWRYQDPARLVAGLIGAGSPHTMYTTPGGNTPQSLVNRSCLDIQSGAADVVLIGGAEAWRTRTSTRNSGERPEWTRQDDDVAPDEMFGGPLELGVMVHPAEQAQGVLMPVQVYPMFESALRARAGATHAEWAAHLGRLWAGFSAVAAANPNAWIQEAYEPDAIATPGPDNRMVGFPYPKLMNSNNAVEQGAAVLLCSVEAAERLGIPREHWVFPHAGTDGADADFVTTRQDMHSSPAMRVAGGRCLELAGVGPADLAHVDLYSCFPSAVQIAAAELGLGLDRPLTVTGGLSFAGGPWNDYVTHAIATMVGVLRDDPGAKGLVTGNGGFIHKHSFGVYSTEPPATEFRWEKPADEIEAATAGREAAGADADGVMAIESYTVMHDRDGAPERALASLLTDDGRRAWGSTDDADLMVVMEQDEFIGQRVKRAADGTITAT